MPEISNAFVVAMGIGIVFIGLITLVLVCKILGILCSGIQKEETDFNSSIAPAVPATPAQIANKQEIIAAVCAAAAEEMGTDVSAIRVLSFKKL